MEGKITETIMQQSEYFEGDAPEGWELLGIQDNGINYIRYYKDLEGNYRHTAQKKRSREYGKFVLREDESGRIFARRVYPKQKQRKPT